MRLRRLGLSLLIFSSAGITAYSQIVEPLYEYGTSNFVAAREFYREGLLFHARNSLRSMVRDFPNSPANDRAVVLQSEIELSAGNIARAEAILDEFIAERTNSPLRSHALLQRGFLAFERKNYVRAQDYFVRASQLAEKEITARSQDYAAIAQSGQYWAGIALTVQGKYEDAAEYFRSVAQKFPKENYVDDALFALGQISETSESPKAAVEYFKRIRREYPRRNVAIAAHLREVQNELALRDPSSALVTLEQAEAALGHIEARDSIGKTFEEQTFSENSREEALFLRGEAYNLAAQPQRAVEVFSSFIPKYPQSKFLQEARLGAGWAYLNLGQNDEALKYYDAIISSAGDESRERPLAQLYRVVALKGKGDRAQAQKELAALSVQPAYPYLGQILLELGQMQYEDTQFDIARRTLERAERESSDAVTSVRTKLLLGSAYMELGSHEKAARTFEAALQLAEKSADYMMPLRSRYLAEARLKKGIAKAQAMQYRDAISSLRSFIAEHPRDERQDEALFWLAESYYRSDLLTNAEETYRLLNKNYPSSARTEEALYGLGWTAFRKRDFSRSADIFAQLLKKFPFTDYASEVLMRKGDAHYVQKQYSQAAQAYREASQRAPRTEEGQYSAYQLGQALYRAGSADDAVNAFRNYVRSYPRTDLADDALYSVGWVRFQAKRYADAAVELSSFIQAFPNSDLMPRVLYVMGDIHYNMGSFEESANWYKRVLDQYPTSIYAAEAVKGIQYSYMALGRDTEALAIANDFVARYPQTKAAQDVKLGNANLFYTGRNYASAVQEYEDFLKKFPESERNAEALYWLGKSYLSMNDPSKGETTLGDLQSKFPSSEFAPLAILDLGLYYQSVRPAKADSLLRVLGEKFPAHVSAQRALFERGMIALGQKDTSAAVELFRSLAEKYPGTDYGDQGRYQVAMYYRLREQYGDARTEFTKFAQREDNLGAEAQYRIGELWMREKNYEEAKNAFRVVREKFSGYEDWYSLALLNLGETYEKLDDNESAKESYAALVALRPSDDFGKTADQRLKRLNKTK